MRGTKSRVGALGGVGALLLPVSDLFAWPWGPTSSFCSPVRLAGGLLQGFRQV